MQTNHFFSNARRWATCLALILVLLALMLALAPLATYAAPGDEYEVVGAGTAEVNGLYTYAGTTSSGADKYTFVSGATTYYLCADAASPTAWVIADDEMYCDPFFYMYSYYYTTATSLTPSATGWQAGMSGSSPAPTVAPVAKGAKIEKSVTTAFRFVEPGATVTYTLKFYNAYTDTITGVVISDTLPAAITNTSVNSSGAAITLVAGSSYVWNVQDLAAGQTGYITISGQVGVGAAVGAPITNTAVITASRGGQSSSAVFGADLWRLVGPENFANGDNFAYNKLALDRDNIPYIAFVESSGKLIVMRYVTGAWETVGGAAVSSGRANYPVIQMDSSGIPYVAYRDYNATRIKVKKFVSGAWTDVGSDVGVQDNVSGYANFVDLQLTSSNTPYVAYYDSEQSGKTTVKYFDGSSWVLVGAAGFSAANANDISLALNSTGQPNVAFSSGSTSAPTVMHFDGSNWGTVGSDLGTSGWKASNSLILDSNDTLYLAFADQNSDTILVKRWDGVNWVNVGSTITGGVERPVLRRDSRNRLYLVYQSGYPKQVTVLRFDGTNWVRHGAPKFAPATEGLNTIGFDMALNKYGKVYVTYANWDNFQVSVWEHANTVTQTVTGTGLLAFAPLNVTVDVVDRGPGDCLNEIAVQQFEGNHPQATTSNLQTGRFWDITQSGCAAGQVFTVTLTVPLGTVTADPLDKLCRWTGTGWDCGEGGEHTIAAPYITRANITQFSDWTVGYRSGPTAVTLSSFREQVGQNGTVPYALTIGLAAFSLALGGLAVAKITRRRSA